VPLTDLVVELVLTLPHSAAELARRKQLEPIADVVADAVVPWLLEESDQQVKDRLLATVGTLAYGFPTKCAAFKANQQLDSFLTSHKDTLVAAKEVSSVISK